MALGILVSFGLGLLVSRIFPPTENLFDEVGWKSYRDDRSRQISLLLWLGANPDEYSDRHRGKAPIHEAVTWGRIKPVRQLIDAGADLNLPYVEGGETILLLDLACRYRHAEADELVEYLISVGAKRLVDTPTDFDGRPNPSGCFDEASG